MVRRIALLAAILAATPVAAGEISWTLIREVSRKGPFAADLRGKVNLRVPTGFRLVTEDKLRNYHELMNDAPLGDEAGVLLPEDGGWVSIVTFPKEDPLAGIDPTQYDGEETRTKLMKWNEAVLAGMQPKRTLLGLPNIKITGWTHKPTFDPEKRKLTMGVRVGEDAGGGKRDELYYTTVMYGPNNATVAFTTVTAVGDWQKQLEETKKLADEFTFPTTVTAEEDSMETMMHYAKIGGAGLVGIVVVVVLARLIGAKPDRVPPRPAARRFGTPR
jgi:uncharacterized membrane-anchored protein